MRKDMYLILCILMLLPLILGGCAGNHEASAPSEMQDDTASEEGMEAESASAADDTPILETLVYEYEIQELYAKRDENQIYGIIYIPKDAGEKMPAVIFSHGFGGNYQVGTQYAEALAEKGYVVYCFDFCGGSQGSRSDGSTLEMSIFTEQADLEAVIHMMQEQSFVDKENIFLMGTSQGGAVSAITAAANKEEIKGAILLYPAFVLVDRTKEQFENVEDIPDTYDLMWMTVGRAYAENLLDYDIFEAISAYDRDVLLIHGDADSIVPLSYSEKAVEVYDSARLEVLPGAGHGFSGEDASQAVEWMLEYLTACREAGRQGAERVDTSENNGYESVEGMQIRMLTDNTEIIITLNDSRAAADLVAMLPLELTLIERNNFAKGMTLSEHLSFVEATTREYEIGDFGYWNAGPDLAIFYDDIYEQTMVEVIPLGHAETGAETIKNEAGTVRLELVSEEEEQTENK